MPPSNGPASQTIPPSKEPQVAALYPTDSGFNFSKNVLAGIQREKYAPYDSDDDADLSPLSSLTPSPSPSRSASPVAPEPPHPASHASPTTNPSPPKTRAQKRVMRAKATSRRHKKQKKAQQSEYAPKPALALKHILGAEELAASYSAKTFDIATTGYQGTASPAHSTTYTLEQLIGPQSRFNLKLKKWDGRSSMPVVDDDGLVIGVCAGTPLGDDGWDGLQLRAADSLEAARPRLHLGKKDKNNRRGNFPAFNVGISHGNGQHFPKLRQQHKLNQPILEELQASDEFQRISGFQTGAFSTWAPRLHRYQNDCINALIKNDPSLLRNFPHTPWAATAFNFGPRTICYKHADYKNLAFGWCAITALGRYDHTKGGHLVLWDLGWVIEFPPGSTILIPSSAIHHSNTRIQAGERRYSVTQYSAGALFRWAENGFQTSADRLAAMEPAENTARLQELAEQLTLGLSYYSTVAELEAARGISISKREP